MSRLLLSIGLIMSVACSSFAPKPAPAPSVPPAVPPELEQAIATLRDSLIELTERLDVLNNRIQKVENQSFEVAANVAAMKRLPGGSTSPLAVKGAPTRPAMAQSGAQRLPQAKIMSPSGDPTADYGRALVLHGEDRQEEARALFRAVYEADPEGELADNALYWIGETHLAQRDFKQAQRYYQNVVDDYPEQNKAPDAFYKLGLVQVGLGDILLARATFSRLIERYPYSTPAAAAREELKRLRY